MTTAEDMDMQMVYRLTAIGPDINHDPEPVVGQPLRPGGMHRCLEKLSQQKRVFLARIQQTSQRFLWHDQKVCGCLGRNVSKGKRLVVLVEDVGGYLAADDLAEDGV